MQDIQRGVEHSEEEQELHKSARGHGTRNDFASAQPQDQHCAQSGGELHGRVVARPGLHHRQGARSQGVGSLSEAGVFVGLTAKEFDLPDPLEVVHQEGVHGAAGLTAGSVAGGGSSSVPDTAGHQ